MKRIVILLLISFIIWMNCKAQVYTGGGIGLNVDKVSIVSHFNAGIRMKTVFVQGGFIAPMNSHDPTIFYYSVGKTFWAGYGSHFEFGAGYSHSLKSNEDKSQNSSGTIFYAAIVGDFELGELIYGVHYTKNNLMPTFTMRILFKK
jgi:hypothetical protein